MTANEQQPWPIVRLGDILASPKDLTYGVVQPGKPEATGTPIVRVTDIRHGVVDLSSPMRINPAVASKFRRSELAGGELLITLVGTVGESAVASAEMRGWNTARAVGVARFREDIGSRWVSHALRLPAAREFIRARLNTTVQATLNLSDLKDVPIVLPPDRERRQIGRVLDGLEDKVASNFGVAGRSQALLRALLDRSLSRSGQRLPVREVFRARGERVRSPRFDDSYVGLEHMDGFKLLVTRHGLASQSATANRRFVPGDVLFGRIRPYFGNVGLAIFGGVAAQSIEVLVPTNDDVRIAGLLELGSARVVDLASSRSTGTTMPQVRWESMEDVELGLPTGAELTAFNSVARPLVDRMAQAMRESGGLDSLYRELVPALLLRQLAPSGGVAA